MDSEQIRAEMSATRARIDRKLDLLQARVSEASTQTLHVAATAAVALTATAVLWTIIRHTRRARRRRRRISVGWA